ncbi:hypothetical protein RDWZM_001500 [Blomia tropicalis]|uniref:RRM domain-containing protein n=1 Tax=Blomia tropicalis TaxID=40697 RepID=A0A9Q0RQT0_BLOTA|nr:hypothetical protein RDWZM_001500 [Blomia tropicalis]
MLNSSSSSVIDQSRKSNLNSCNSNEIKHDSVLSFSANMNGQRNDKIWSLIDSTNSEDFGNHNFSELNQEITFADSSLMQKSIIKRVLGGAASNSQTPSGHSIASQSAHSSSGIRGIQTMANSNHFYGSNNTNKNHSNVNWPVNSQMQNAMQSQPNWSNSFNSNLTSMANSSSNGPQSSNSMQNVWSNNAYSGFNNHQQQQQQRRPLMNSNNMGMANNNKKSPYQPSENQPILPMNVGNLSPSKYRRHAPMGNMKNYNHNNLNGPTNLYELGSAGSDNTSSSSDSANLRENGILQLQDRNQDTHCSPLDSLRYSLEPQLLEIMRNSQNQDNKIPGVFTNGDHTDDKKHLKGKNFARRRGKSPFFTGNDSENLLADFASSNPDHTERFSRKVFVGGLPPDIDEEEITASFRRFGPLIVDWPHKAESKSYFPPKGYAFLLFQDETSVQILIDACIQEEDKLYLCVSSPTIKDKPVQIRPWRLSDADYVLDGSMPLDPRKTVFVGGVPRPLKAVELAMIMDRLYGGVCYAGIDTDPELKYPKGAGRVAFSNQQSYIAAISARFVQLQHADIEKRVEVKPYVLDDQICDECQGVRCAGKFAPYFCANITCLQYYCENCWATIHSRAGREFHKPLVKEGADRPRAVPFRWC